MCSDVFELCTGFGKKLDAFSEENSQRLVSVNNDIFDIGLKL